MDFQIGDVIVLKKEHPCGSRQWKVLRIGGDIKIRCQVCGHLVMLARHKLEKQVVKK